MALDINEIDEDEVEQVRKMAQLGENITDVEVSDEGEYSVFVDSTNVLSVSYDKTTQQLMVSFHSGYDYVYFDVPYQTYYAMIYSGSVGSFVWTTLHGRYDYVRM